MISRPALKLPMRLWTVGACEWFRGPAGDHDYKAKLTKKRTHWSRDISPQYFFAKLVFFGMSCPPLWLQLVLRVCPDARLQKSSRLLYTLQHQRARRTDLWIRPPEHQWWRVNTFGRPKTNSESVGLSLCSLSLALFQSTYQMLEELSASTEAGRWNAFGFYWANQILWKRL